MNAERKELSQLKGEPGVRERVAGLYNCLVSLAGEMPKRIALGEDIEVKTAKRFIQYLVDMITDGEPVLVCMALSKGRYAYSDRHPVNVGILSIALGHKIGFSKKELAELGLVAFLSDIGKYFVPSEVKHKQDIYDENDWREMKRHTAQGFKVFFRKMNSDEHLMRAAIVSFEHHLHYDLSGYPSVRHIPEQDFYARIVAIAEFYDGLTSSRSYAERYRSPDRAVESLLSKAGGEFDPVLVRQFISMMGAYPVGSFVLLDTGELGIVVEPHEVFLKRPRVLLLSDEQGRYVKHSITSLSKRDDRGRYLRTVKKTLDPNKYRIDYALFFYRSPRHNEDVS
jgi:HD-GYP domain-containing protein (c-di-GMP phosphodiesterase class II)